MAEHSSGILPSSEWFGNFGLARDRRDLNASPRLTGVIYQCGRRADLLVACQSWGLHIRGADTAVVMAAYEFTFQPKIA
jgi:hypothetical protein